MGRAWRWDEAKVRRFLAALERAQQIHTTTDAGQTVITIRNYDQFQAARERPDAGIDVAPTQGQRSAATPYKNGNNGKEDSPPFPPEGGRIGFDEFWNAYPVKQDQGHAERAWDQVIADTDPATILAGLRRFRFGSDPPKPQAWLRAKRWADQADDPPAPRVTSGPEPVAARVARAERLPDGRPAKPGLVRMLLANDWGALQAYEAVLREREMAEETAAEVGGVAVVQLRGAA